MNEHETTTYAFARPFYPWNFSLFFFHTTFKIDGLFISDIIGIFRLAPVNATKVEGTRETFGIDDEGRKRFGRSVEGEGGRLGRAESGGCYRNYS